MMNRCENDGKKRKVGGVDFEKRWVPLSEKLVKFV